jgi:hypothetical protein
MDLDATAPVLELSAAADQSRCFMRLLPSALTAFLLLTICAPGAFADDATTYAGTLGKAKIIVELQAPGKGGAFFGRYAYMIKGIDIPLHGVSTNGVLTLEEEKPCTDKLCRKASGEVVDDAPIGAEWSLKPDNSGDGLAGTWTDKDSGKSLPVKLARQGVRKLKDDIGSVDMMTPGSSSVAMQDGGRILTSKDLPYDFLKLGRPYKQGKVVTTGDSAYRMDLDSRAGLDFPTVIKLGDADHAALDHALTSQRLRWVSDAFWCYSVAYLGNGWSGSEGEGTNGFADGDPQVTVDYLTPRLMGITESGSYFCGGAHPDNFENHILIDARTGQTLGAKDFLSGWVARDADGKIVDPAKAADPITLAWGPDDKLAQYVLDHRDRSDPSADDDCGIDDLVRTNLGVYFKGDKMILALVNLPYASMACGGDMVEIPLKDARPFLTETGARYFAELDK